MAKELQLYLPSVIKEEEEIVEGAVTVPLHTVNQPLSTDKDSPAKNNFTFNFLIKNTEDISHVFSLPFYNVEPATISGVLIWLR